MSALSQPGTVSLWIGDAQLGNGDAVELLWRSYGERLTRTARARLIGIIRVALRQQAEEAAQSAFFSFYEGLMKNRFETVKNRESLWRLLHVIVDRKALGIIDRERAERRGGGLVRELCESDHIPSKAPDPLEFFMTVESIEAKLSQIEDASLVLITRWTFEGYTQAEIAERLGCTRATVNRKLTRIREILTKPEP